MRVEGRAHYIPFPPPPRNNFKLWKILKLFLSATKYGFQSFTVSFIIGFPAQLHTHACNPASSESLTLALSSHAEASPASVR